MTYLRLKNDRLRISLTKIETEQIFGSSEKIERDNPKTVLALKLLLKRAIKDNSFSADCSSVFIEVVKNLSGGYDIYFTKSSSDLKSERTSSIMLEFARCEDAINASKSICRFGDCSYKSDLYRISDKYRMSVAVKNGIYDLPGAIEFAERVIYSKGEISNTQEHGKALIEEKAIEILSKL